MRTIIVAAGQGSRLQPLTNNKPKCLVEINSKPLLEYQLDTLKSCNITDISIIGGHCANQLKSYPLKLFVNEDYKSTNMVYSLFTAEEIISPDQDLIISYGDIIYNSEILTKLIEFESDVSVVVDTDWRQYWQSRMDHPLEDAETLKLSSSHSITEIGLPAKTYSDVDAQYIGLIKIKARKITELKKLWHSLVNETGSLKFSPRTMYMTELLQYLIKLGWDVKAVKIAAGWAEVDTVSDLGVAFQNFKK